jgi:hypothetical protein
VEKMNDEVGEKNSLKQRRRYKLKEIVPDQRIKKLDFILETIKAYYEISQHGEKGLKYTDFKGLVGFSIQYVSGLNKFLEYIDFLEYEKGKQGRYKPTKNLVDYQHSLDSGFEAEAKDVLRKCLKDTWFNIATVQTINLKGSPNEEDIVSRYRYITYATENYTSCLKVIVKFLEHSELIKKDVETGLYSLNDAEFATVNEKESIKSVDIQKEKTKISKNMNINDVSSQLLLSNRSTISIPVSININIAPDIDLDKFDSILRKIKERLFTL